MFRYVTPKVLEELKAETTNKGRLYTLPDGSRLPSITTVLGAMKKQSIMEWRQRVGEEEANKISRNASSRGTKVHKLAEDYLNNLDVDTKSLMPHVAHMFKSIKPYLNKINNIHYQEATLWSKTLGLAGRVDCIGEYDGVLSVIDFKTSSRIKTKEDIPEYFQQCCGYSLMYEEMIGTSINSLVVIMAVEGDEPLIFKEKTKDHIDGLVRAIKYYKDHK
jgi:genome maintenance exonuclease 1